MKNDNLTDDPVGNALKDSERAPNVDRAFWMDVHITGVDQPMRATVGTITEHCIELHRWEQNGMGDWNEVPNHEPLWIARSAIFAATLVFFDE